MEKQNGLSRDTGRAFLWIVTGMIEGETGDASRVWEVYIAVSERLYCSVGKYILQFLEYYIMALEGKYCCFGKIIL